jgi:ubiquinone/menaquinone biosynthesis C-methylase UbiE
LSRVEPPTRSPLANYDGLAPWFAPLERLAFRGAMQSAREAYLDRLASCERVLVPGPGDGRGLAALLAHAPRARLLAVEPSSAMQARARRRLAGVGGERVDWCASDVRDLAADAVGFDAVVTDYFLDQFEGPELRGVVDALASRLRPGGLWTLADFHQPARGWRAAHARLWLAVCYAFFGRTTGLAARRLEDPAVPLAGVGMERLSARLSPSGLFTAQLWRRRPPA